MRFSIVIPLFNKADYIVRAIRSVLNQTHSDFELIIVNDGSTDSSAKKARGVLDSRIKVIDQENQGVSSARNTGAESSHSEFVCFLDADDEWDNNYLERISELISDYPDGVLYSTGHRVIDEGVLYDIPSGVPVGFRGYIEDFFESSLSGSIVNSSKVSVSRKYFARAGGFPVGVTAGEDMYLWARLALLGQVVHDTSILVTIHRVVDSNRGDRVKQVPYLLEYYSLHLSEIKNQPSLKRYVARVGIKHVAGSVLEGDYRGGVSRAIALCRVNCLLGAFSFFLFLLPVSILGGYRTRKKNRILLKKEIDK